MLPIALSLVYALLYTLGLTGLLSTGLTTQHWTRTLTGPDTWRAFALSVSVAASVAVIATAGGLAVALLLRRQLEAGPLSYVIHLPLALPATVAAFAGFQLLAPIGLLSRIAVQTGISSGLQSFPALTNDRLHIGIVLIHVLIALPFMALLFAQVYGSERLATLTELALSLGATRRQALLRVTLPVLLSRCRTSIVLLFVAVTGSYEIPLLLGRQYPLMISVLTVNKYNRFDLTRKPEAFALAILYAAFCLSLIVLAMRWRKEDAA